MSMRDTLGYLYSLTTRGIRPGLDRVRGFLDVLGNPQNRFRSVHVAGTNGKGTVCHILYSVLRAAGVSTGLYTSPHIKKFNERIIINGRRIPDGFLCDFVTRHRPEFEKRDLTFFEITTAMAFDYFVKQGVEWAVIETGLGGRLDATNVLLPRVSVICDLSMDHEQYLGKTLADIAYEKAGILKKGVPAIIGVTDPEAKKTVLKYAGEYTDVFKACSTEILEETASGTRFHAVTPDHEWRNLFLPLPGAYQLKNALIALCTLEKLHLPENPIRSGLENTRVPARLELRKGKPDVLFDVAHNPAKAKALDEYLRRFFKDRAVVFVFGVMADKDYRNMLGVLDKKGRSFIFARPDTPRAAAPEKLLAIVPSAEKALSVKEAFGKAKGRAGKKGLVVVTGSFFTVAEVYP